MPNSLQSENGLDSKTKTTMIVINIFFVAMILMIIVYAIRQLRLVYRSKIYDVYRVMQCLTLLLFCISGIVVTVLMHFDDIVLYTIFSLIYMVYGLYSCEVVSITWWVNLIWQIDWYSKCEDYNLNSSADFWKFIKIVKRREKFIIVAWAALLVILVAPNIMLTFVILLNHWVSCNPRYYDVKKCPPKWEKIGSYLQDYFKIAAWICLVFLVLKVWIGSLLIYKLKRNLNFYYISKRFDIVVSIVSSWVVFGYQAWYIFWNFVRDHDIIYRYSVKISMNDGELIYGTALWICETFIPFIVMVFNVRTVNFK